MAERIPISAPDAHGPAHRVGQVRGVLAERVVLSTGLDPFMSLGALAGYSGLSTRTLRRLIELPPDEALPCYRLPGRVLVRRSEFDAWIERYRSRGRPSLARALAEVGLPVKGRRPALT